MSPDHAAPLGAEQIRLLKESWRQMAPDHLSIVRKFYERLFVLDPGLRTLFAETDFDRQAKKFLDTLTMVIHGIGQLDVLGPAIGHLGMRHVNYGVREEHYPVVRSALLEAMASTLGEEKFPREIAEIWSTTFDRLAEIMTSGIEESGREIPGL